MAVATIPVLSREYVWVPVTAEGDDAAALLTTTVEFAFISKTTRANQQPGVNDWVAGSWSTTASSPTAQCLVGPTPSAIALAADTYIVWLRITGATERPVRQAPGELKVV